MEPTTLNFILGLLSGVAIMLTVIALYIVCKDTEERRNYREFTEKEDARAYYAAREK